jgi:hypothetical protein
MDKQYRETLSRELPQYATDQGRRELGAQARKTLAGVGVDEQKLNGYWNEGKPIYMREASAQALIAKAAAYDLALAKANELSQKARREQSQRSQPMTPGGVTVGPRGGADAGDEKALLRKVSNAKGERAQLMAAVQWQQAKYGRGR